MATEQVLHMNKGVGETSYANNSSIQRNVMLNAKHILEEGIIKLYSTNLPECLTVADLGCSSGPNALMVACTIIKIVHAKSQTLNLDPPMFQFFLNDLFANDFNTIFKSIPEFDKRIQEEKKGHKFGQCFISGTPGTFYGRLFPNKSIHLFHSSMTLHWLSQTPKELINEAEPLNKGAIYLTEASPPAVHRAYFDQFQQDFKLFLRSRSEELLPNGCMFLNLIVSDENIDERPNSWDLIGMALNDMVKENLIEKKKLDSYNVSSYFPTEDEVMQVIHEEGSFHIQRVHKIIFDMAKNVISENTNESFLDEDNIGERLTKGIRAITEPILKAEFGEEIMDELFLRYKSRVIQLIRVKKMERANLIMYMIKN